MILPIQSFTASMVTRVAIGRRRQRVSAHATSSLYKIAYKEDCFRSLLRYSRCTRSRSAGDVTYDEHSRVREESFVQLCVAYRCP